MKSNNRSNLLKFVMTWNCAEEEATEEFLYDLRGKMAFDLDVEFPLLDGIEQEDMQFKRKNSQWEHKYYSITFSDKFKEQILEHYPEHLI